MLRESDHPTAFMCAINAEVERMTYKLNRTEEVSAVIMSHAGEGLRIRLIAASRYDCPKCEVAVNTKSVLTLQVMRSMLNLSRS